VVAASLDGGVEAGRRKAEEWVIAGSGMAVGGGGGEGGGGAAVVVGVEQMGKELLRPQTGWGEVRWAQSSQFFENDPSLPRASTWNESSHAAFGYPYYNPRRGQTTAKKNVHTLTFINTFERSSRHIFEIVKVITSRSISC
jgi:hypothetical protein